MEEVAPHLRLRTEFIRRHYATAAAPFAEIKRLIEDNEEPYVPPYSEDGEPAFLQEWIDADTSIEILGAACVSMLADALKLYFMTWERELQLECQKHLPDEFSRKKGKGFVNGYRACFGKVLETDWSECPADWSVIEQVVLARNDAQHAKRIYEMRIDHSPDTWRKHPLPFFLSESERGMIETDRVPGYPWFYLSLVVTAETLSAAASQVEALVDWLEPRLYAVKYGWPAPDA